MPIYFLTRIIIFLFHFEFHILLLDISFVYFDESIIPFLWICVIDDEKYLTTQVIVYSLFVFEL